MLDTLRFVVLDGHYEIKDTSQFSHSVDSLYYQSFSEQKPAYLIAPDDLADCYFPQVFICKCLRITCNGRKVAYLDMFIECSVPKFLKGENLFSIREEQKEVFTLKMSQVLGRAGIIVSSEDIINAPLRKLHVAHNMLSDFPVSIITDGIAMVDAWKYDPSTEKDGFRNGGECYHIHHSAYELAFYNKVTDIVPVWYDFHNKCLGENFEFDFDKFVEAYKNL